MHTRQSKISWIYHTEFGMPLPPIGIRALLFYNDAYAQFLDIEGGEMLKGCRAGAQAV